MKHYYLLLIIIFINSFQMRAQIHSHITIPQSSIINTDLTTNNSIYSIVNFNSPTYTIQNQTFTNASGPVGNGLGHDTAILKFNTNFVLQNYWHFGGARSDYGIVVHEDNNNNLYVALASNGSLTINNVTYTLPASGQQTLIIKIDSTGQVSWVKKVDQSIGALKIKTYNNDVFIGGGYNGGNLKIENTTVSGNQMHPQLSETFVVKLNATNGALQWLKTSVTTSGTNDNMIGVQFVDMELDSSGNPVIIASLFSPSTRFDSVNVFFGTSNAVTNNAVTVIAKYTNTGNVSWAKAPTVNNNRLLLAEDLDIDGTGNIYISANATGGVNYWGTAVNPTFTTMGMYGHLFKLNASGSFQWAKANTNILGGLTIYGIKCVQNDVIVMYRALNSQIIDNQSINIPSTSAMIGVFGNNGTLKSYNLHVPSNPDPNRFFISNILHYNSAGFILSGHQSDNIILDNSYSMPLPDPTNFNNKFIIKSGEFLSTKEIVVDKWKVYPNPAKDEIFVEGEAVSLKYKIYDLSGRIVDENLLNNSRINVSNLSNGIYVVELTNDEFIQKIKIIKE